MAPRAIASKLQDRRLASGLTQSELGARAGVSRQLVAAVEAGQNTPGVEAALGLARALGTTVEELFASQPDDVVTAFGDRLRDGAPVRVGRVGERLVAAELDHAGATWDAPDGVVEDGTLRLFAGAAPAAFVVAGCDPALGVAEAQLPGTLALAASTGSALEALEGGRVHGAVVHGPPEALPEPRLEAIRIHLARWQVGLGVASRLQNESLEDLLRGADRVVQREPTAASQQALERTAAARGTGVPTGPRAGGHLEAARMAVTLDCAAITTEGAAAALGLHFRALEEHTVEVWLLRQWEQEPSAQGFANLLAGAAFTERVARLGGYDLAGCGTRLD